MSTPTLDRALHYGDGVFETLRAVDGRAPLFDLHFERLCRGADYLGLKKPAASAMRQRIARTHGEVIVKLIYSAGSGERGYARGTAAPIWRRFVSPYQAGVERLRVKTCVLKLAWQPRLAGIKHLNRLEQVLARAELESGWDEGLMFNERGDVQCGISSNVLLHLDGRWVTPEIVGAGVAGVARRWLIESGAVTERRVGRQDLVRCVALGMCNALHGPRALVVLDDRAIPEHADIVRWRQQWTALFA